MNYRRILMAAALPLSLVCGGHNAYAETYPNEPVRLIVPFAAGGSSDTIARLLSERLSESLNGTFIVENMPGAGTLIGTSHVMNSDPDGHTLLVADVPFTVNPSVADEAGYDPRTDFTPVALVGASSQFLYSRPDRFETIDAAIEEAEQNPRSVTVAHAGIGTTTHLMSLLFADGGELELTLVPYGGSAPALTDTAAGHTDLAFSSFASAASLVDAGQLHVLAATSSERLASMPNVPTFTELGIDDLQVEHWWGILGPAGLPPEVVELLNEAVADAVQSEGVKERFAALDVAPRPMTPEEFSEMIDEYTARWELVVEQHGVIRD